MSRIEPSADTIVARATAPGEGGVAIVRLSGADAIAIADSLLDLPNPLKSVPSGRIVHGWIRIAEGDHAGGDGFADEVLVAVMRAPHSYTCEDVIEINCHGGMRLTEEIVEACARRGARRAERGEFTQRAFLNGRLDLAQAEAVLDLVRARTRGGIEAAGHQLRGDFSARLATVRDAVATALTRIEAGMEFEEDDLGVGDPRAEAEALSAAREEIGRLAETYARGRLVTEGASVAIVGPPNVGKSSLLNSILGRERAIVSPIPGTTRDLVEAEIELDGVRVRFVDTAGLRETGDEVEREGTRRAELAASGADVVVLVCDASGAILPPHHVPKARTLIVVANKADIASDAAVDRVRILAGDGAFHTLSALTGVGVEAFVAGLRLAIVGDAELTAEGGMVLRERHADALRECAGHLDRALEQIAYTAQPDLVAADLRLALDAVGRITGETTPDDVLDAIFGEFCIGK